MDTSPAAMLSKEATQRSYDNEFDAAIALLRQSCAVEWQLVPNRARVARWLQQSGKYRESLLEFALIINEIPPNVIKWGPHLTARVRIAQCAHQVAEVCDQARISCAREKDSRRGRTSRRVARWPTRACTAHTSATASSFRSSAAAAWGELRRFAVLRLFAQTAPSPCKPGVSPKSHLAESR